MQSSNNVKHILIVEDDRNMQDIYRFFFEEEEDKYNVDIEGDAPGALKRLKEKSYNLIISDIIMDPMPGDVFISRVRDDNKTLPVLFVSVIEPRALAHLKKLNCIAFLHKPVTKERLLTEIARILG